MRLATTTKLKIISLLAGMMFWYGIEQLFMNNVISDPNIRALATTVYTITLLALDIPGGIIADRFGRRKTILLGMSLQALSVLIMGVSSTASVFLLGVFIYGIYWALCNGAAQAMMYDHLAEDGRHGEYAKHQGSAYAFGYFGAGIANVSSGVIAHFWGLRAPYILSVIPAVTALIIALTLKENRQRSINAKRLLFSDYFTQLAATLKHSRFAAVYALQIVIGLLIFMTICEFGQVTLLSYHNSAIWLGLIWAIDAGVVALALHYAHRLQKWPWQSVLGYTAILLSFATFVANPIVGTILFIATYAGVEVVHNVSETELQHATKSAGRATVLSSVNFIGNALAIGAIWIFNHILRAHGIFPANQTIAIAAASMLVVTALFLIVFRRRANA